MKNSQMYKNLNSVVIPFIKLSLKTNLIIDAYLFVGHIGTKKTFEYLNTRYFWENIYVDVHEFTRSYI